MGFFDFLKKEAFCESCGIKTPKSKLNQFDSTVRDEIEGELKTLCRNCLMRFFEISLKKFDHRAVMIHPLKKMDTMAYQYYPFEEMGDYDWPHEQIKEYEKFLPPEDAKCHECEEKAPFNWCSGEIYFNDPFSTKVNTSGKFSQEYLCAECLLKKFKKVIEREDITFSVEFWPPYDGNGMATSFEA
ncbi:MAG TPA: hypothetical protein VJB34_08335 [Bdellovibrionota bacterium]|nr:hypothetical protein [Bdellovibrionota bacterium]